jgi:hypothetical protein
MGSFSRIVTAIASTDDTMPSRSSSPIYRCGDHTYSKQFARRADGQWFYRVTDQRGRFGRWLPCSGKPDYAWYDPRAGRARLPND